MYGWIPVCLPSQCVCGNQFNLYHASAPQLMGINHHNEIHELLASLMTKVCTDVAIELVLQHLTGETLHHRTTSADNGARLDICARDVWGKSVGEHHFWHKNVQSKCTLILYQPPVSCYWHHEQAKRNNYVKRIHKVEWGSFTPLIFSVTGGASPLTTTFRKHLISLLAEKCDLNYSIMLGWLRAWLNFSLIRSAIMCICGSQSTVDKIRVESILDLAYCEAHLSPQ